MPVSNSLTSRGGGQLNRDASAKRRKVRKGTRSCWECKRRKIKCIFASIDEDACVFCQRRRTTCVSQELPEDLSPARPGNRFLGDRISRVEDLMKEVLASKSTDVIDRSTVDAHALAAYSQNPARAHQDAPAVRPACSETVTTERNHVSAESLGDSTPKSLVPADVPDGLYPPEHDLVLRHLFAAFPCEEDSTILLRASTRWSRYNYIVNTQPSNELTFAALAAPQVEAKIPPRNSHPITVAQCMLVMAITLQIPQREIFSGLSEPRDIIMHRLVRTSATWVTNQQEMQGTVECLICIMLEGMFETNGGNLRRAWTVYRKAMTVAQLMGLHRSPIPILKRLNPNLDASPEAMWFRINYMDRYLSLLLGLPHGSQDKSMASAQMLQNEAPLGKFERLLTVVAADILERNERAFVPSELTTTLSIDAELLKVSKSVPASFFRSPDFHGLTPGQPEACLKTPHVGAQVFYYGLLLQLHIPYMMSIGDNSAYEYSKITCVNSGREILTRYISHRSFNPISSCSRPVDFYAFLAAMTLLLAHIDAHHNRAATNYLAHSRLGDRDMLEQVLERMDVMASVNNDALSTKSATVIRRLLNIEEDAAGGTNYTTRSTVGDSAQDAKEGEDLQLHIPYLGTIKISRQHPVLQDSDTGESIHEQYRILNGGISQPMQSPSVNNWFSFQPNFPLMSGHTHGQLQEPTSFGDLDRLNQSSMSQQHYGFGELPLQLNSIDQDQTPTQFLEDRLTPIAAAVDDWVFQGVDLAFFDSLMRGMSPVDNGETEQQMNTGEHAP